jgi:hypothetical protein
MLGRPRREWSASHRPNQLANIVAQAIRDEQRPPHDSQIVHASAGRVIDRPISTTMLAMPSGPPEKMICQIVSFGRFAGCDR